MYDLFVTLCGVPEEIFANSDVLQKWFTVASFALAFVGMAMFWYAFVMIFRIFMGGGRK